MAATTPAPASSPAPGLVRSPSYERALGEKSVDEEAFSYDPKETLRILESEGSRRGSLFENSRQTPPTRLEFSSLTFSVGPKKILDNVSGHAFEGQVLAIMGPSGAGKTSLLDCLAGRLVPAATNTLSGSVLINGQKRDFDSFRQLSAYVLQQDNFFAELTVKETILLSAQLRLPKDMPESEKEQRVEQVLFFLSMPTQGVCVWGFCMCFRYIFFVFNCRLNSGIRS